MKKICSIIVTFNRRELLARCARAVMGQTCRPDALIIVDNASTDSTFEYLCGEGIIADATLQTEVMMESVNDGMRVIYYRMPVNKGGAGGFHKGLELAHRMNEFDAFWMMDDDGYPSPECLEKQLAYLDQYDYVMPVSINIDEHSQLSLSLIHI